MTKHDKESRPPEPAPCAKDPHDAGIRLDNEEALAEGDVGPMSYSYSPGGNVSGKGLGATRDDLSNRLGSSTGAMRGGKEVPESNLGSTDVGPSDITGGGDASGLGATDGGDTA